MTTTEASCVESVVFRANDRVRMTDVALASYSPTGQRQFKGRLGTVYFRMGSNEVQVRFDVKRKGTQPIHLGFYRPERDLELVERPSENASNPEVTP